MAIIAQEQGRLFTIHTANTTYQMKADPYGVLLHLYYGRRCEGSMEYLLTYADRGFSGNIHDAADDRAYSLDVLPQEFPVSGTGDMRSTALTVEYGSGTDGCDRHASGTGTGGCDRRAIASGINGCDLRFAGYRIRDGKYSLPGLPAVYASDEEAQTLEITLRDTAGLVEVTLLYGCLPELDIITRSAVIRNISGGEIRLTKVMSANLDLVSGDYDLITFYGRHALERQFQRTPVAHMEQWVGSRRGTSSHHFNPMMILAERETTESAGGCYAMQFVYSGGFSGCAGLDQIGQTRIQLGLMREKFSYPLAPGESFTAPEVIMSYSGEGLAKLSHNLHACIRGHICRGKWRDQVRPVLLNSWEACYMDFDGGDILSLADQAAELGMDMLVLDDGWFGKRRDDKSSLGDWYVNEQKLRAGLDGTGQKTAALSGAVSGAGEKTTVSGASSGSSKGRMEVRGRAAGSSKGRMEVRGRAAGSSAGKTDTCGSAMREIIRRVHEKGLLFGLWVEPEMISEDSDLYRAHPDWAMVIPGRKPVLGRSQLVLDFSRKEVVDAIFTSICEVLDMGQVDYLKWDCNRSITDVFSYTAQDQGRVLYDYVLGLYDFLERLTKRYPDMLIEGCSGGGGRFDAGMLYYTPQIWCSDNTDPVDRALIQYGTSFGYPSCCVGAHVSASPNEQNGRVTPLRTRGIVAMSGTFGYELDPGKLSASDRQEIRKQIAYRREAAELIHKGKYYRLSNPCDGESAAWAFVSKDRREALLNYVNLETHANRHVTYIRLQGLQPGAFYRCLDSGKVYPADALMQAGLPMPFLPGDYGAVQMRFIRV